MEARLIQQVMDFEAAQLRPAQCVFKWRGIALEVGIAESTLRRFFSARGIRLPRWGVGGRGGGVFLPKAKIILLRAAIFGTA